MDESTANPPASPDGQPGSGAGAPREDGRPPAERRERRPHEARPQAGQRPPREPGQAAGEAKAGNGPRARNGERSRGRRAASRWRPSVTVAAVIEGEGRYLLVEEHTPEGLRFNNPAGHLEPGESPEQGAVREALEETAFRFEPQGLVGVYLARRAGPGQAGITYLRFAYAGRVAASPEPGRALDQGIVRTVWMTLDEAREAAAAGRMRSPLVMRSLEDHAAGRRFPLDVVGVEGSLALPVPAPADPRGVGVAEREAPDPMETTDTTAAAEGAPRPGRDVATEPALPATAADGEAARRAPQAAREEARAQPPGQSLGQVAALLAERFPGLFGAGVFKPIKLRVQADIQQRAAGVFTRKSLSIFLHRHTTSTPYLRALVAAESRFDLDGQPAGDIAAEHKEAAQVELERRRQIVQQRRAAEREANPGPAAARSEAGSPEARPPRGPRPDRPPAPRRNEGPPHAGQGPSGPDAGVPGRGEGRGGPDRRERFDRGPRGDRPGGPGRSDPGARGDRPGRPPWPDRGDRPHRGERDGRPPREPRDAREPRDDDRAFDVLPDDPARRERALLLRAWESSPLTPANFCVLKGLKVADFEAQVEQARQERQERREAAARAAKALKAQAVAAARAAAPAAPPSPVEAAATTSASTPPPAPTEAAAAPGASNPEPGPPEPAPPESPPPAVM